VAVHMALSGIQRGDARPFDSYPLAADYLAVVQAVQAAGYQPEKIEIDENIARVQASTDGQDLIDLNLTRGLDGWKIAVELVINLPTPLSTSVHPVSLLTYSEYFSQDNFIPQIVGDNFVHRKRFELKPKYAHNFFGPGCIALSHLCHGRPAHDCV